MLLYFVLLKVAIHELTKNIYHPHLLLSAVTCAPLENPDNGELECTDGENYNSDCTFSCNDGYALDPASPTTWTCQADGTWSVVGSQPTCKG